MGRRALALLAERLVAGSAPRHEAVPVSLVRRETIAPPPRPRHRVAACRRV